MCYKDGRGVVPPAGIRPIQMPHRWKTVQKMTFSYTVFQAMSLIRRLEHTETGPRAEPR